jgi:hypothetical protein
MSGPCCRPRGSSWATSASSPDSHRPKLTCEQISAQVEFEPKYYGDLCNFLADDIVYGLFKRDDQPLHLSEDVADYGPVKNFR